MISTVIFDMNGVITDDEACHEAATKAAFAQHGFLVTPEIYREYCLGRTDTSAFKDIIEAFKLSKATVEPLIADKTRFYLELVKDNLKIYPGVLQSIERMYQKYNLALATSSTFQEVQVVLDRLDLRGRFKVVVCAGDVRYGKPHPEPYLLTAEKLGVSPVECMVIEDSENGVRSAKAAGMKCIAIPNTEAQENLLLADSIVGRYSEITAELIESL